MTNVSRFPRAGILGLRIGLVATLLPLVSLDARGDTLAPLSFHRTIESSRNFPEVERISRNHSIGEYRGGELTLRRWVDVEKDVWLGLDQAGSLFQILTFESRTVAFLLSGRRHLVDCFYAPGAPAIAIDDQGEVFSFAPSRWAENPRPGIVRRHAKIYAAVMIPIGAVGYWATRTAGIPLQDVVVPFATFATGGGLLQGLVGAMEYGVKNDVTDGLRPIGHRLEGYRRAETEFTGPEADLDYILLSAGPPVSLRGLLETHPTEDRALFARSCEANLARGIPLWTPFAADPGEIGSPAARPTPAPAAPKPANRLLGRRE